MGKIYKLPVDRFCASCLMISISFLINPLLLSTFLDQQIIAKSDVLIASSALCLR